MSLFSFFIRHMHVKVVRTSVPIHLSAQLCPPMLSCALSMDLVWVELSGSLGCLWEFGLSMVGGVYGFIWGPYTAQKSLIRNAQRP